MIKGMIVVPCSKVIIKMKLTEREENLLVSIFDENGKRIKKLVFDARPDSTQNLMVFEEHRTK